MTYSLYHSRYGFRQVHFGYLILYMRHFSDVIIDIHHHYLWIISQCVSFQLTACCLASTNLL